MLKPILLICLMSLIASVNGTVQTVCTLEISMLIVDNQAQLTENMMIRDGFLKDVARYMYCLELTFTDRGCLTNGNDATAFSAGSKNYKSELVNGRYIAVTSAWFSKERVG